MMNLVLVGAGGAAGAIARYLSGVGYVRLAGPGQPYVATFGVNVVGGLLMGLLVGFLAQRPVADPERWRLLLAVGVLGGFTTFSSFSLEVVSMLERRAYGVAAGYVAGSVVLSVLGVMAGLLLARRVFA